MPYRIKAQNVKTGQTITRLVMEGDNPKTLVDAKAVAQEFALSHGRLGLWEPVIEYYDNTTSIANPDYDRTTGTISKFLG